MGRQGRGSDQHRGQAARQLAKKAAKQPEHRDKYADRAMENKLRLLAEHHTSEERELDAG